MKQKIIFLIFFCLSVFATNAYSTPTYNLCEGTSSVPPCVADFWSTYPGGTWSSTNAGVAYFDEVSGEIIAVSPGNTLITYTVTSACGDIVFSFIIVVDPVPVITSSPLTLCVGSCGTVTASPSGGTWTSGSPNVTVTSGGVACGVIVGTAKLTYTLSTGCLAVTIVTVNPLPFLIGGPAFVCGGQTITLTNPTPGGTWSSSNVAIATVSSGGVVTGVSTGTVTITYMLSTGCYRTKTITVEAPVISGPSGVTVGSTISLTASIAGGTWSSSTTGVATVDASTGVVTGVSAGTTTITYMLPSGCYDTHVVTVCEPFTTDICEIAPIHSCDDVISYCDNLKLAVYGGHAGDDFEWSSTPYDLDDYTTMTMDGDVAIFTFTSALPVSTNKTYTMTVTNSSGCTSTTTITILVTSSSSCYPCNFFKPCIDSCVGCDTVQYFKTIIPDTLNSINVSTTVPGNYFITKYNTGLSWDNIVVLDVNPAPGSLFMFGEDMEVDVYDEVTLDGVHLFSPAPCQWEGIILLNNSTSVGQINVIGNTLIEHATIAAISVAGATPSAYMPSSGNVIESDNAIYNLNKVGIGINPFILSTSYLNYPFVIKTSVFTSREFCGYYGEPETTLVPSDFYPFKWPSANYLKTPVGGVETGVNPSFNIDQFTAVHNNNHFGIGIGITGYTDSTTSAPDLDFYGVTIGDSSTTENTNMFDTLACGVYSENANVRFYNNIFRLTPFINPLTGTGSGSYAAIWATLSIYPGSRKLTELSHGANTRTNNRFYNCQNGLKGDGLYDAVSYNSEMSSSLTITGGTTYNYGFNLGNTSNPKFRKHIMEGNTITNIRRAIFENVASCTNAGSEIRIKRNTLTDATLYDGSSTGGFGINVFERASCSSAGADLLIDSNYVEGFQHGIFIQGNGNTPLYASYSAVVSNNTVVITNPVSANATYKTGIRCFYSKYVSEITNNHVYGDITNGVDYNTPTPTTLGYAGIEIEKSSNNGTDGINISCNYVHDLNASFRFQQGNEVNWNHNVMLRNTYGMILRTMADVHSVVYSGVIGDQGSTCSPIDNMWYDDGLGITSWPGWDTLSNTYQTYTVNIDPTASKLYVRNSYTGPNYFYMPAHNGPSVLSGTPYSILTPTLIDAASGCGGSMDDSIVCGPFVEEGGSGERPAPAGSGKNDKIGKTGVFGNYAVFPNPSDGNLTIKQTIAKDVVVKVKVMNYAGAEVHKGNLKFKNGVSNMNIGKVSPGMYMIVLNDDNGQIASFKVVIE